MKLSFSQTLSDLPTERFSDNKVTIRPIRTEEDLAYAIFVCQLTPEQQALVNPAGFSIGRAFLNPNDNLPCLICTAEGRPIGFILFLRWLGAGAAVSWSFFIDSRHQRQGYGRAAAALAVQLLKAAFPDEPIKLSTEAANAKAQALYRSLGFRQLDEMDGDDLVFCL